MERQKESEGWRKLKTLYVGLSPSFHSLCADRFATSRDVQGDLYRRNRTASAVTCPTGQQLGGGRGRTEPLTFCRPIHAPFARSMKFYLQTRPDDRRNIFLTVEGIDGSRFTDLLTQLGNWPTIARTKEATFCLLNPLEEKTTAASPAAFLIQPASCRHTQSPASWLAPKRIIRVPGVFAIQF